MRRTANRKMNLNVMIYYAMVVGEASTGSNGEPEFKTLDTRLRGYDEPGGSFSEVSL